MKLDKKKQSDFLILRELEKQWKENYSVSIVNLSKVIIVKTKEIVIK